MTDPTGYPQLTESEQRKRKQTLERAKANYLSGQLRLRLQYARLKVEHGWQRQNLNEVENLYFRHSHMKKPPLPIPTAPAPIPSPELSGLPPPTFSPAFTEPAAPGVSHPTESHSERDKLSTESPYPLHPADFTRNTTQSTVCAPPQPQPQSQPQPQPQEPSQGCTFNHSHLSMNDVILQSSSNLHYSAQSPQVSHPKPKRVRTKVGGAKPKGSNNRSPPRSKQTSSLPNPQHSQGSETQDPSGSSSQSKSQQSRTQKPHIPRGGSSNFSSRASFGTTGSGSSGLFGSSSMGSPLTYDSFWSSHSLSTQSYRNLVNHATTSVNSSSSQVGGPSSSTSGTPTNRIPSPVIPPQSATTSRAPSKLR